MKICLNTFYVEIQNIHIEYQSIKFDIKISNTYIHLLCICDILKLATILRYFSVWKIISLFSKFLVTLQMPLERETASAVMICPGLKSWYEFFPKHLLFKAGSTHCRPTRILCSDNPRRLVSNAPPLKMSPLSFFFEKSQSLFLCYFFCNPMPLHSSLAETVSDEDHSL